MTALTLDIITIKLSVKEITVKTSTHSTRMNRDGAVSLYGRVIVIYKIEI